MKIVSRKDLKTLESQYGITGVDTDGCRQLYPYNTHSEATLNLRLLQMKAKPKDPRFVDKAYKSTLKALDRI